MNGVLATRAHCHREHRDPPGGADRAGRSLPGCVHHSEKWEPTDTVSFDFLGRPRERGRVTVQGCRTDDRSDCTLLVIHEAGGSWAIHGLGAPGVRLSKAEMVALVEAILARARCGGARVSSPTVTPGGIGEMFAIRVSVGDRHLTCPVCALPVITLGNGGALDAPITLSLSALASTLVKELKRSEGASSWGY